jgi:hypothetical protein
VTANNQDYFVVGANNSVGEYYKVAEMPPANAGQGIIQFQVAGVTNYGNNNAGLLLVNFSTRIVASPLTVTNLSPSTVPIVSVFGWLLNADTGKYELWCKRGVFNYTTRYTIMGSTGGTIFTAPSRVSDEPTGITYVTSSNPIATRPQYYLSTSNTTQTGASWADTIPVYQANKYYWNRTATKYADGTETYSTPVLDSAMMTAISGSGIPPEGIQGAQIASLDAGKITSGYIAADRIAANSISSTKLSIVNGFIIDAMIATATITSAKIATLDAAKITTGTLSADRIAASSLNGNKITAGTITADRLNVTSLSAIKADLGTVTAGNINGTNMRLSATNSRLDFGSVISGTWTPNIRIEDNYIRMYDPNGGSPIVVGSISLNVDTWDFTIRNHIGNGYVDLIAPNGLSIYRSATMNNGTTGDLLCRRVELVSEEAGGSALFSTNSDGAAIITASYADTSLGGTVALRGTAINCRLATNTSTPAPLNAGAITGTNITASGTLKATGATTLSNTLTCKDSLTITNTSPIIKGQSADVILRIRCSQTTRIENYQGSAYGVLYASAFTVNSAYSKKKNISKVDTRDALDKILATDIVKYRYISDDSSTKRKCGIIVNDNGLSPYRTATEFVEESGEGADKAYGMSTSNLIGYTMAAVKELHAMVQELQATIRILEESNETIN